MSEVVLLVGASGRVGRETARRLRAAQRPVRAMVRAASCDEAKTHLRDIGCELVIGDLKDHASLASACEGAVTVVSSATAMGTKNPEDSVREVDECGQLALVRAAESSGVRNFVFVSFPPLELEPDFALQKAKRLVEARLKTSALSYTILQASFFLEVWFSERVGFSLARGEARIFGSGTNPVSWVSLVDVARFAAASVLDRPRFGGRVLPLGGASISPLDVLATFERLGAPSFKPRYITMAELAAQRSIAPDAIADARAALGTAVARGLAVEPGAALALLSDELISISDYGRRISAA